MAEGKYIGRRTKALSVGKGAIDLGDPKRFDEVFVRFYAPLCQFALGYLSAEADAEDVVESLFMRLWDKSECFENEDHARASLYRATFHACLNHQRGRLRSQTRDRHYASRDATIDESYLPNFLRTELVALIHREIDQLPEQYATVLRLSFREDLKNEEIADRLQLQVQTVKNYKSKGLALLKNRIPQDVFVLLTCSSFPW